MTDKLFSGEVDIALALGVALSPEDQEQIATLVRRCADAEAESRRLRELLSADHTGLARALGDVRRDITAWMWLPAGEWGSYSSWEEQNEATLRKELRNCFDRLREHCERGLRKSGRRLETDRCDHKTVIDGPRVPLRHGSAKTLICVDCGSWRKSDFNDRWRPADTYSLAFVEDDDGEIVGSWRARILGEI
jgi:hypothetical protein